MRKNSIQQWHRTSKHLREKVRGEVSKCERKKKG